jgi:hypothetical protein
MAANFDAEEFVDEDFHSPGATSAATAEPQRAPTREEVETRVSEMQQKLADLKRAQKELEEQRTSLEELRRRQGEFATGRQEMTQHLIRGIGLLEEAELNTRREAEQLGRILRDFREALDKLQAVREETWTKDNLETELTRASTAVENARMEWNSALVKLPLLSGEPREAALRGGAPGDSALQSALRQQNYAEMCKMGLALTWPIALTGLAIFLTLLMR